MTGEGKSPASRSSGTSNPARLTFGTDEGARTTLPSFSHTSASISPLASDDWLLAGDMDEIPNDNIFDEYEAEQAALGGPAPAAPIAAARAPLPVASTAVAPMPAVPASSALTPPSTSATVPNEEDEEEEEDESLALARRLMEEEVRSVFSSTRHWL